jgi:mannose-6-phosphate isomerase-like protein (cupin superfamily)
MSGMILLAQNYESHAHKGEVTLFITQGDVTFYFSDSTTKTISTGERFDVPKGVTHEAVVGKNGCDYVVGEMIEGDSEFKYVHSVH